MIISEIQYFYTVFFEKLLETITKIHKEAAKFLGAPVRNEKGQKILAKLKSEKKKVLSDIVDRKEIQEKVARWF